MTAIFVVVLVIIVVVFVLPDLIPQRFDLSRHPRDLFPQLVHPRLQIAKILTNFLHFPTAAIGRRVATLVEFPAHLGRGILQSFRHLMHIGRPQLRNRLIEMLQSLADFVGRTISWLLLPATFGAGPA